MAEDKKYSVVAKLREATENYYNRLNKINNFTTIKLCDDDFYFLEYTHFLFVKFYDVFATVSKTTLSDTYECLFHGYSSIDFTPAKNDALVLKWLKDSGFVNGNTKKLDLNLAKVLGQNKGTPIHFYIFIMILIHRGTYSLEEYTRDFNDIYFGAFTNKLVPIIPYSF